MAKFKDTDAGAAFIASADSRDTSPEIMEALAFFARDLAEAEALWNGDRIDNATCAICTPGDLWENVTKNGMHATTDFCWGAAGSGWWNDLNMHA